MDSKQLSKPSQLSDIHRQLERERAMSGAVPVTATEFCTSVQPSDTTDYAPTSPPIHTHASGARRSQVMPYYSAIPAASLRRLALRATGAPRGEVLQDEVTGFEYHGGSDGYGYRNWQRGLPCEDTFNHIIQHLYDWYAAMMLGVRPQEDELAAAAWGIMMPLMKFEERYLAQAQERERLLTTSNIPPESVDEVLEVTCHPYLLQPLSPRASRRVEATKREGDPVPRNINSYTTGE